MAGEKVCIVGCSVIGLTTGIALASLGHRVRLFDGDEMMLSQISRGRSPFYEPDVSTMLAKGIRARSISVEDNLGKAVESSDFLFLAVPLPITKTSTPNTSRVRIAAESVGEFLSEDKIVVQRSVAPPGTAEKVIARALESHSGLKVSRDFGVAVNPGFLSRGTVIQDILRPSRIIVGGDTKKTAGEVMELYSKIDSPKLITDLRTAEMIKLATDSFLATKSSLTNEIAALCESIGVDAEEVMEGVRLDPRISDGYIRPGLGFGGCGLPKDLSFTISAALSAGLKPEVLRAVQKTNDMQPLRAIKMLEEELGNLCGKRIAILGLAFKAGIDDVTGSRAFPIAIELLAKGAKVVGYDPLAKAAFIKEMPGISYASSAQEALLEADGCVIQTAEKEFSTLGKSDFDLMKRKVVVDGARVLSPVKVKKYGVAFRAIGLGEKK